MKTWVLSAAILFGLAPPMFAQTVSVRAGEHAEFTRVIIDLPARAESALHQDNRNVMVMISSIALTFDTSSAFAKIPRTRVTDIVAGPDPGSLSLTLGCDCEVSQFWHGRSLLVLDVRDRAATETGVAPANGNIAEPDGARQAALPSADTDGHYLPLTTEARGTFAGALVVAQLPTPSDIAGEPATPLGVQDETSPTGLQETQDRLLTQLGRAATQGLLTPSAGFSGLNADTTPKQAHGAEFTEMTEPELPIEQITSGPAAHINLNAQSSIDRDFRALFDTSAGLRSGLTCLTPAQIDVGSWGTGEPFAEQIGALRINLTGEFDRVDETVATDLARLYLYFGFGAEARQTLSSLAPDSHAIVILMALSEIMENGHAPQPSALAGQLACEGPAALWSALSYSELPENQPIDTDAILRAFNALPAHLRGYLGPILTRRFVQAGRPEPAEKLLRILQRNTETLSPDAQLVSADMNLADGANEAADETLHEVVATNSQPSADALVKMIETRFATGEEISHDLAQLAGAYVHEREGTPIFSDLARAYITALNASGRYDTARKELVRLSPELDQGTYATATSRLIEQLSNQADDMTFLRHAMGYDGRMIAAVKPEVANTAATRLLDLGFIDAASGFVTHGVDGTAGRDRRIIRARISLSRDRPRQAEVDLLGLTGRDANLLRANARSLVGEHGAAYMLYTSGEQTAQALREAWLNEDWGRLRETEDSVFTELAQLMDANPNGENATLPIPKDEAVLARNRRLLADSITTRETLDALLLDLSIPQHAIE